MKHVLALFDFSAYSVAALKAAQHWSQATNSRLHVYHNAQLALPGFTPDDVKKSWAGEQAKETKKEVKAAVKAILGADVDAKVHVHTDKFLPFMLGLLDQYKFQAVFLGVKGRDFFSDIFSGSVVPNIISNISLPIVAVQSNYDHSSSFQLLVNVDVQQQFPAEAFRKMVTTLGSSLKTVEFVCVVPDSTQNSDAVQRLSAITEEFSDLSNCHYLVQEGASKYETVLELLSERPGSMLVLQKGVYDHANGLLGQTVVFDLMQDAKVPVIILN